MTDDGDVDRGGADGDKSELASIGDVGDNDRIVGCGESNLREVLVIIRSSVSPRLLDLAAAGYLNGGRFSSTAMCGDRVVGEGLAAELVELAAELLTTGKLKLGCRARMGPLGGSSARLPGGSLFDKELAWPEVGLKGYDIPGLPSEIGADPEGVIGLESLLTGSPPVKVDGYDIGGNCLTRISSLCFCCCCCAGGSGARVFFAVAEIDARDTGRSVSVAAAGFGTGAAVRFCIETAESDFSWTTSDG